MSNEGWGSLYFIFFICWKINEMKRDFSQKLRVNLIVWNGIEDKKNHKKYLN